MSGCKVHFPIPVEYDPESEYTLILRISRKTESAAMEMICKPIWINIIENKSYLGFSFLRSPDTPELSSLIEELKRQTETFDMKIKNMLINSSVDFI
jgi:hypothetical protein